jgi:hypothetical protein
MTASDGRSDEMPERDDLPPPSIQPVDELVTRFFNEELSQEEQSLLAESLRSSISHRDQFVFLMQSESHLFGQAAKRQLEQQQLPEGLVEKYNATLQQPIRAINFSSRAWMIGVASTIAVCVALLFGATQLGETQLSAAELFKRLEHVSNQQLDRVYAIERLERRNQTSRHVQGELRCRGTESFVTIFPDVVLGSGPEGGFWFVPVSGDTFTVSRLSEITDTSTQLELGWIEFLLGRYDENIAINATNVLALIRLNGYQILREPNEVTQDGHEYEVLRCQLLNQTRLPRSIKIRSKLETQEIFRMDFDWIATNPPREAELISLELKSVGTLPAEEFLMQEYIKKKQRVEDTNSSAEQPARSNH